MAPQGRGAVSGTETMNTGTVGVSVDTVGSAEQDTIELFEVPATHSRAEFLLLAAQELRNPLHALTLQIQALRQTARHTGNTTLLAQLGKTQTLMARYADRTELLLELIRIGEQRYPLQSRPCDLPALAQGCAYALRADAAFHGAQLRVDAPTPLLVRTDGFAVEQITLQLLGNAIRHADATLITLRVRQTRGAAELSVVDNGRGLPAEFTTPSPQRFAHEAGADRGHDERHFGLGLWSVYELAEVIGAQIQIDNARDQGASFTLRVPFS